MADELTLVSKLNKEYVPVTSTQQLVYVLVQVKPNEVLSKTRMRVNFGFVLDHSGSMRGDKIDRLKQAVELAVGKLAPEDQVSVTIFNDSAQVIAPYGAMSSQPSLLEKVRQMRAGGGTQMSRGLITGPARGLSALSRKIRSTRCCCSPTVRPMATRRSASSWPKRPDSTRSPIQALGLGDDWNEELLDQVGQLSGGDSDLVESADEIVPLFTQTVERSQKSVVRNAQMILRLVSGVVPRQVWQVTPNIANLGYTPVSDHDVQVQLGELDAEQGKALLIEVLVPPRQPGRYRIGQAECKLTCPRRTSAALGCAATSCSTLRPTLSEAKAVRRRDHEPGRKGDRLQAADARSGRGQGGQCRRGHAKAARRRHAPARAGRKRPGAGRHAGGGQPGKERPDVGRRHQKAALPDSQADAKANGADDGTTQ